MESFREVDMSLKWTSYVIWVLAVVALLSGTVWLAETNSSLSQVVPDITAGRITMDKVGLSLSTISMEISLAFGTIGLSGILIGIAAFLYTRWASVNLQARSEHHIRAAVEVIVQEIRSNRLNSSDSTVEKNNPHRKPC